MSSFQGRDTKLDIFVSLPWKLDNPYYHNEGEPKKCAFAVWDDNPHFPPGWCHLAEDGCSNERKSHGAQVKIWKKPGENRNFKYID